MVPIPVSVSRKCAAALSGVQKPTENQVPELETERSIVYMPPEPRESRSCDLGGFPSPAEPAIPAGSRSEFVNTLKLHSRIASYLSRETRCCYL